ncbi:MAG TPA: HEAT repeat domain-containing protein [Pyrinomonadaceae bacterium]|jgi:HEAT repeat protein|nr:HEAT repeat domain-containing protein [Pyrinomonadaceae bacterium]
MRLKALATLLFAFALALAAGFDGGARAQRRRAPKPRANDNTAQASQNDNRPKHVFIGHGSDTPTGSRMTVTSDNPLNDYRAYRSGDRFYVELPNANADTSARASGHGFSDMQVQRRGKSVVLSYRIQPGAKPHVEQRFNRLEVVFDASEGAQGNNAAGNNSANRTAASAAENRNPEAAEQTAGQTTPAQQNPNITAAERRAATQAEAAAQTQAAGGSQAQGAGAGQTQAASAGQAGVIAPTSPAGEQPTGVEQPASNTLAQTAEQTPNGAASPAPTGEQQLAQSQPPSQVAPITATDRNASAQPGASLGTFLLRNWELSLIIALAIAGFGLILAARRSSAVPPAPLEEAGFATQTLEESRAPRLQTAPAAKLRGADANGRASEASKIAETAALPVVAASALVGGAAVEEKEEVEPAKEEVEAVEGASKSEEAERQSEQPAFAESTPTVAEPSATAAESSTILVEPPADELPFAEPSVVETVAEQPSAEETAVESFGGAAAVEAAPGVAHEVVEAGEKFEPEPLAEVAAGSVGVAGSAALAEDASAKGIAPAAPPEQERVEAETRRLLEGETYDRAVVGTTNALARQLIAAELLSALSGRNAERRERARAAFVEHGYFDEMARDLHMAEAPAERAAAARFLAITGDRAATPHLIAALEDESAEVRRASVEALGALRDPSAVKPLERLLESETGWRNRVPSRVIRHALETCREAAAEGRAAAHAPAKPAPEVAEVTEATEVIPAVEAAEAVEVTTPVEAAQAAPSIEAAPEAHALTTEVEAAPEAEAFGVTEAVELAPAQEPPVEVSRLEEEAHAAGIVPAHEMPEAASVVEESIVALAPFADEVVEPEEVTATEEAPALNAVTAVEVVPPEEEVEEAEALQPPVSQVVVEPPAVAQLLAFETFEPAAASDVEVIEPEPEVESAAIEPRAEEAEVARGESSVEISPVATDEWFDFDLGSAEHERQPSVPLESQPAVDLVTQPNAEQPASVFESSSGEALTAEPAASEAASKDVREVEHFAGEVLEVEAARGVFEPGVATSAADGSEAAPPAETSEKGVVPFDEFSTVPASIQQRLASREADERASAIVELSHVDTDEAFQHICAAFDDDAKEVRAAAARALYDLRDDRAESFTRALREAEPERRRRIGAAIASSGLAGDAISQLTGESREKTYEAFSLLFLMAKAGEVQPLIRAIEGHPNSEVRLAVVKLLALSGQKEILPAFRRLAVRGSLPTEVRSAVMEAIYQISSSQPSAA